MAIFFMLMIEVVKINTLAVANNPLHCRNTTVQNHNCAAMFASAIKTAPMAQINAYLNFNGNTKQAMTFYKACLGGELVMQKISESPMAAQMPGEMGNKILHSSLTSNGIVLMAGDCMGAAVNNGNNIALCINCGNEDDVSVFFDNLAAGGKINEPLQQSFLGATFGSLTDKFGIHWIFNHTKK
jgi:PhnB protein